MNVLLMASKRIRNTTHRLPSPTTLPSRRGQAMVEFALSISLFLLIFMGFMMMAMLLFAYLTANSAAREGAHLIVSNPRATNAQVADQICTSSFMLGGRATCLSQIFVSNDRAECPPPSSTTKQLLVWVEPGTPEDHTGDPKYPERLSGTVVGVTVCYRAEVPTPRVGIFDFGPVWVRGRSVMSVE